MPIAKEELLELLKTSFSESDIAVIDTIGDQDHYTIEIRSDKFIGLNTISQHQLVYSALGKIVGTKLHAISLKTSVKSK